jgi:HD-GYP domain-containing protein (c-di-GMP phosphodiesterase class II)
MSLLLPSSEIRVRLVALIQARRRDIVAAVLRSSSVTPHTISMASSGFVGELLDGFRREFDEGDRSILERLAEAQLSSGESRRHTGLVRSTCTVLATMYAKTHGSCEPLESYFAGRTEALESALSGVRARPRKPKAPAFEQPNDEVVASLLSAIEARNPEECEHSRVTGAWCGRLAKVLGLGEQEQIAAVLSGTIHDIGKIATPSEILLKADPLTPEEWEDMKAHTLVGAKMLERIPSLRELAPVARWHHERVDGLGYPDGLVGEAIPFMVRLVSVADAFHGLITSRPHRPAHSISRALEILKEGSGTHWDASIVDAFVHLVRPASKARALQRRVEAGGA